MDKKTKQRVVKALLQAASALEAMEGPEFLKQLEELTTPEDPLGYLDKKTWMIIAKTFLKEVPLLERALTQDYSDEAMYWSDETNLAVFKAMAKYAMDRAKGVDVYKAQREYKNAVARIANRIPLAKKTLSRKIGNGRDPDLMIMKDYMFRNLLKK